MNETGGSFVIPWYSEFGDPSRHGDHKAPRGLRSNGARHSCRFNVRRSTVLHISDTPGW